jgi:hypothetical protein
MLALIFQKLLYSGHKRAHGINFQSVVLPDGLFPCMLGLLHATDMICKYASKESAYPEALPIYARGC